MTKTYHVERHQNTNLHENEDQPLQRNRKTNNTERRKGNSTGERLNIKRPNTNNKKKWQQVEKPRKTGPQKCHRDDSGEHIPFKQ